MTLLLVALEAGRVHIGVLGLLELRRRRAGLLPLEDRTDVLRHAGVAGLAAVLDRRVTGLLELTDRDVVTGLAVLCAPARGSLGALGWLVEGTAQGDSRHEGHESR